VSGKFQLRIEAGGPRNYLDGRGVHSGEGLELKVTEDGCWLAGRYEYKIDDEGVLTPLFYFSYDCGHHASIGCACELLVKLPANATLRWPEKKK
jgi:hypothetical protein